VCACVCVFACVQIDSLLFSAAERPVTMQPLFGVLYSVGSFGVLLALGPSDQVAPPSTASL